METYYKHSGKVPAIGVLFGFLAGILVSIPASYLYDYGIIEITTDKLRFVCTIAFGALVGLAAGMGMFWGKVRNNLVAAMVGAATSLAALYISWGIWIIDIYERGHWISNPIVLLIHPKLMWHWILELNATGTWAMEHESPTAGTMLWLVWSTEALFIVGFGVLVAVALMKRQPFCEQCDSWCSKIEKIYYAPTMQPADLKTKLENRQFECLPALGQGSAKAAHFRVVLHSCPTCGTLNTMSLMKAFPKDQKTLIDKLLLSASEAESIRHARPAQAIAAGTK